MIVGITAIFLAALLLPCVVHADSLRASQHRTSVEANERELSDAMDAVRSLESDRGMADVMRTALVTKLSTQRMIDDTLIVKGEVVSFSPSNLERVRVTSDGSDANVFKVLSHHLQDDGVTIRVLKKPSGKIEYVSIRFIETGERIGVEAIGKVDNDMYAVYSSDDVDVEAMNRLRLDYVRGPSVNANSLRSVHAYSINETGGNNGNGGNNRALQSGTCGSYKVIRMNAKFDAGFCANNGGTEADAIDRINFIVSEFNDSYMEYPLCTKVETCGVTGSCNVANDDFASLISNASNFCGGGRSLVSEFRNYVYPSGASHRSVYPNGECDATHLFFGNDVNGNDWFPSTDTIGCAYTGAICGSYAVGVSQVGQYSNVAAQSVLVAHELGHNLNAQHDSSNGAVMAPSFCATCRNIPESFSSTSTSAMISYIASRDSSTCVGSEQAGPTAPTPSPPTRPPTRPPTPAPVRSNNNGSSCNQHQSFAACFYGGCVWNGSQGCFDESQTRCEDLTNYYYCLYNDLGCAWYLDSNSCREYL